MNIFNQILNQLFDYLFKPFDYFSPLVRLCLISAGAGILLIKLFGLFSNQEKIREAKNHISAHLLGVVLYKDDIRICLREQRRLLKANLLYMIHTLLPLLILVLLCIPILTQLNLRYGYRPLAVGEKANITVTTVDQPSSLTDVSIRSGGGLKAVTPPVRIKEHHEVVWKIEAIKEGKQEIQISLNGIGSTKRVDVGAGADKITPLRSNKLLDRFFHPGEEGFGKDSNIESIRISYSPRYILVFGHPFHWILIFCAVSMSSGLLFKRIFKVEI